MKKVTLVSDKYQNDFDTKVDVKKINEDLVKEYQREIMNNKILLNTSFSHDSYVNINKKAYRKILSSLFSIVVSAAGENSRIIFQGDIDDNNYCIRITNERNKSKNIQQLNEIVEIRKKLNTCRGYIRKKQGKLNIKVHPEKSIKICCYLPIN